jgi:endonuclease G
MQKRNVLSIVLLLSLLFVSTSLAAQTACPEEYLGGIAPEIISIQKTARTTELCSSAFGVMYSGVTKTPLWSAEHLTREHLEMAHGLKRTNNFHPDNRLPQSERAELSDYFRSSLDRGHCSPNGDMPTIQAQNESFALSNMMPQDPDNNRHLWEGIESAVRTLAKKEGALYVITGPLWMGTSAKAIGRGVYVPDHIFKIVYNPKKSRGAVYFCENKPGNAYDVISISQLEEIAGVNFFPQLTPSEKSAKLDLPVPTPHYNNDEARKGGAGSGVERRLASNMVANTFMKAVARHTIRRMLY